MSNDLTPYDIPPALLRQRRNLLIVSLLILFLVISDAQLKSISLLGMQMVFNNPDAIFWFLKIFLLYFLYRYYLYLKQEPDLHIKSTFYMKLNELTHRKLHNIKNSLFPDVSEYGGEYDFRKMKYISLTKRGVTAVVERSKSGGVVNNIFEVNILQFTGQAVWAMLHTIFNRSYVTDYFLPFFIAFTALATGWNYHG